VHTPVKFIAISRNNKIYLYYNENNILEGVYNLKGLKQNSLFISKDNNYLFAITNSKGVYIWEIGNPRKPTFLEFKKQPLHISCNVSSSHIVLVFKNSIKVFKLNSLKRPSLEIQNKDKITSLCYTYKSNEMIIWLF
jgi:hypothetical protein